MSELVITTEQNIRYLTLNRPEKRNALNDSLIQALANALSVAKGDATLRAVVINAAGADFCSGADLSALQKIGESTITENLADAEKLMELFLLIRSVSVPVIAAVHGRAFAGGAGLATACDLVVASRSARFGYPEVKIGFVPAMVMAILRRNVSEKRALELITRGGEFTSEAAERMGLVNRVFDDQNFEDGVREYAAVYEKLSRSAVMLSKKLLYQMDNMAFDAALQAGAEVNAIARMTEDCKSGIAKFLDKK